jgi:hypothetical protein
MTVTNLNNLDFISDKTTRKLAGIVKHEFNRLYAGMNWQDTPFFETVCFNQVETVLGAIYIPKDCCKLNLCFLQAIENMGNYDIKDLKEQLYRLPLSEVDKLYKEEFIYEE